VEEKDPEAEEAYRDSMVTFEAFEEVSSLFVTFTLMSCNLSWSFQKIAHPDITQTCLAYLSRFREFDSVDRMKRVVGLLHRQAVRVKAEGLFFKVYNYGMNSLLGLLTLNSLHRSPRWNYSTDF
jgi:replication fork protection complex subunit Tof1/Swi1